MLLNVNMPDAEPTEVEGVEITVPGNRAFVEGAEHEVVGRREHYWIKHNRVNTESDAEVGTDVWAMQHNRVSISSISPLLTDGIPITRLRRLAEAVSRAMETSDGRSRIVTVGPFPVRRSYEIQSLPTLTWSLAARSCEGHSRRCAGNCSDLMRHGSRPSLLSLL